MRPDDTSTNGPHVPQRQTPPTGTGGHHLDTSPRPANDAAANILRGQIDNIYASSDGTTQEIPSTTQPAQADSSQVQPEQVATPVADENPYERNLSNTREIDAEQWQQYHSAWQNYYQKYYERYYVSHVQTAQQQLEERLKHESPASEGLDRTEAMNDLRSQLRHKATTTAKKVQGHKLFIPIASAISVMALVLILQYNQFFLGIAYGYTQPANKEMQPLIPTTASDISVGPDPLMVIPRYNISVPIDFNATPDHNSQMAAMEHGAAYFGIPGANSKPGQKGNTPISGHSSNDFFGGGEYKFIFAQLVTRGMGEGDPIYVNYEGKRYTYSVIRTEVVMPNEANKLQLPDDKPYLTIITCTPIGTADKRLLVIAEQISPDPAKAAPAPTGTSTSGSSAAMPGSSPSALQRLFGAN